MSLRWPALALVLLGVSWLVVSRQYDETVVSNEPQPVEKTVRKSITIGPETDHEPEPPVEPVAEEEPEPLNEPEIPPQSPP